MTTLAARDGPGYDAELEVRGHGPPLVFVPGMDGTGRLFYRQIPALSTDYRVVTYRLRDEAASMEALIDDLRAVLDHAAPDAGPAVVVGESFGGTVAVSFALAHPERVAALVVLNSFPYFAPRVRLWMARRGLALIPWGAMHLVRRMTAFRMHSRFTHRREVHRFLELSRGIRKHGYLNRLKIIGGYDVRERLREIRVPTLFLAAEKDHLVPSVEQGTRMAARVPGAELRVLAGHGHVCMIAPGFDLAQILREWRGVPHAGGGP
jgi:pimeloyl-ACP methyl ester carboxylesterase